MYRVRNLVKVSRDGWNGAIETAQRLNEISRKRGWQEGIIWTQSFGPYNEIVIEYDYPDLATYEREQAAVFADDEAMKVWIEGLQYVRADVMGQNELWQRAEPVAGA